MKVKDDIARWRKENEELKRQMAQLVETVVKLDAQVQQLSKQVETQSELTVNVADGVTAMLRQQLGD